MSNRSKRDFLKATGGVAAVLGLAGASGQRVKARTRSGAVRVGPIDGQPMVENAVLGEGRHDEHLGIFPGFARRLAAFFAKHVKPNSNMERDHDR